MLKLLPRSRSPEATAFGFQHLPGIPALPEASCSRLPLTLLSVNLQQRGEVILMGWLCKPGKHYGSERPGMHLYTQKPVCPHQASPPTNPLSDRQYLQNLLAQCCGQPPLKPYASHKPEGQVCRACLNLPALLSTDLQPRHH